MKQLIPFLFLAMSIQAAPVIQKAETIDDKLLITGKGFGAGPRVAIYDDFDRGTAGQPIPIGPAVVGSWVRGGSVIPKFGKDTDGNGYMKVTYASTWLEYIQMAVGPNATNVFMAYRWRVPEGKLFPGEGSPDKLNWKVTWIQDEGTTDGDLYIPVFVDLANNALIDGNDSPYGKYIPAPEAPIKGRWHYWQFAMKGSSTDGSMEMWSTLASGIQKQVDERKPTLFAGDTWQKINFPGYGRAFPGQEVHMDSIYVADGPNAKARIMLGNNVNYTSSTLVRVTPPDSWTDTQIKTAKTAMEYVTVFDASGVASNTMKIGAGSFEPPPPVSTGTFKTYPFSVDVSTGIKITGEVTVNE